MTNHLEAAMAQREDKEEEELSPLLREWPESEGIVPEGERKEEKAAIGGEKREKESGAGEGRLGARPIPAKSAQREEGKALGGLARSFVEGARGARSGLAAVFGERAGPGEEAFAPESRNGRGGPRLGRIRLGRAVLDREGEIPSFGERRGGDGAPESGLYHALRRSEGRAAFARGGSRQLTVALPEVPALGGLDAETLDRAVERDARRYDGGFGLY